MAVIIVGYFFVVIFVFEKHLVRGTVCIFGGSSGCVFPCNCADNAPCDYQTGVCHDRCRDGQPRPAGNETRFDWRGPGCRIGNVALHKVVHQKGVYDKWYANHSVDGMLPSNESEHEATCSHTAVDQQKAWWSVDLQGNYHIYHITIFNRLDNQNAARMENFTIRVGNNSDISMNSFCRHYSGRVPAGGSATLTCISTAIGRYVSMHRIGGYQPHIITICEVVVMGYEVITSACDAGRYGINCKSSCSDHHCKGGYMTCDHVTGECPDGCQDWYIGGKCDMHINEVQFDEILSTAGVNATHINVIWGPDDDISSNLTQYYGYQVQYKASNDPEFQSANNVSHVPGVSKYITTISGLHYNTWYILGVSVYRKHGDMLDLSPSPTRELLVKTPCVSPDSVTLLRLTSSDCVGPITLLVVWKSTSSGCDNVSSILVLYKPNTSDNWMAHNVRNPTASTNAIITDVTGGVWEVKVRVMNNEQLHSESEITSVTIMEDNTIVTHQPTIIPEDNQVNLPCSDACARLTIPFAVLFGMSAIVNIVFVIQCVWIKSSKMRTNIPPVNTPATGHSATDIYEGLGARISTERQYDELRMDESQVPREPKYEQM